MTTTLQKNEKMAALFMAIAWLSILPGQLLRWQPSSMGTAGILASDIVALIALPVAGYFLLSNKELRTDRAVQLLLSWLGVVVLSWLLASSHYSLHTIILAAGYVLRLLAYALTFVVAVEWARKSETVFLRYALVSVVGLFLLGLLIIWYLPDFAPLAALGWDPHVGRFTSTWLDPNYLGSFLGIVFGVALCWEKEYFAQKNRWWLLMLFLLICLFSIYLTVSRSAIVTLAAAALIASLRTSWRAAGITVLALALLFLVPSRLQDRLVSSASFVGGATSTGATASASNDPTANARLVSWKHGWALAKTAPILGVGYNYYEQASLDNGLLTVSGETRGTSGSDSSLLTLLATTGWLGLAAVVAFFGYLAYRFFRAKGVWPAAGLAAIAGVAVGSQFNNLLLYPLVLLPFMLALGVAYYHTRGHE